MTRTHNHHCQTHNEIKKKHNEKKNHHKHRKDDLSDPYSSDDSDSSDNSEYRRKRCKSKSGWESDPIKLCAHLTAKLMTTAYK